LKDEPIKELLVAPSDIKITYEEALKSIPQDYINEIKPLLLEIQQLQQEKMNVRDEIEKMFLQNLFRPAVETFIGRDGKVIARHTKGMIVLFTKPLPPPNKRVYLVDYEERVTAKKTKYILCYKWVEDNEEKKKMLQEKEQEIEKLIEQKREEAFEVLKKYCNEAEKFMVYSVT